MCVCVCVCVLNAQAVVSPRTSVLQNQPHNTQLARRRGPLLKERERERERRLFSERVGRTARFGERRRRLLFLEEKKKTKKKPCSTANESRRVLVRRGVARGAALGRVAAAAAELRALSLERVL